jgi:hypothetical protein
MNSDFYVVLPSNSSSNHTNNTQANFTTYLNNPITFRVPYEVCMKEFSYREYISFDIGDILLKFIGETQYRPFNLMAFDNEPIEHFINRINFEILSYYSKLAYKSTLNPYVDQSEQIQKEWNELTIDQQNYNNKYNECKLKCPTFKIINNFNLLLTIPSGTTVRFTGHAKQIFNSLNDLTADHEFLFHSELINFFDYLMVYTDLIEQQYVGDSLAPLLRTITKTGQFNRTTEKIFIDPHYLPVNKSYITSINIDIRDPTGKPARFENLLSKVLVKLHFRPIKK